MLKEENFAPLPAPCCEVGGGETCSEDAIRDFSEPDAGSEEEVAVVIATIREHIERKR